MDFNEWFDAFNKITGNRGFSDADKAELLSAFNGGKASGIAWAERATAELCHRICINRHAYNLAKEIKEKFGLEI